MGNFSEAKSLNILKFLIKDWASGPLSRKFLNGCQAVIQGQGCFIKLSLPRRILLAV